MRYTVYKSLDKSSSLFGMKGTYLYYAVGGAILAAMLSFILAGFTNGLVGILVFIVLLAVDYMAVLAVQAKFSEKERTKWFCSHALPDFILVPPRRMSDYAKVKFGERHRERPDFTGKKNK